MKIEKPNNEISLSINDIHHLSEENDLRANWHRELSWPIELQGYSAKKKDSASEYEIYYPKGDIFISFCTIIHEIGHLRQDEFYESIDQIEREFDAYDRGFKRIKKFNPDLLEYLEDKFASYKKKGLLGSFDSFEELYLFFKGSVEINKALIGVEQFDNVEEQNLAYKNAILQNQEILYFLEALNNSRVGEIIDTDFVDKLILDIFDLIKKEKIDE